MEFLINELSDLEEIEDHITDFGRWSNIGRRVYKHGTDPNRFLAEYYDEAATESQEDGPSEFKEVKRKVRVGYSYE